MGMKIQQSIKKRKLNKKKQRYNGIKTKTIIIIIIIKKKNMLLSMISLSMSAPLETSF